MNFNRFALILLPLFFTTSILISCTTVPQNPIDAKDQNAETNTPADQNQPTFDDLRGLLL